MSQIDITINIKVKVVDSTGAEVVSPSISGFRVGSYVLLPQQQSGNVVVGKNTSIPVTMISGSTLQELSLVVEQKQIKKGLDLYTFKRIERNPPLLFVVQNLKTTEVPPPYGISEYGYEYFMAHEYVLNHDDITFVYVLEDRIVEQQIGQGEPLVKIVRIEGTPCAFVNGMGIVFDDIREKHLLCGQRKQGNYVYTDTFDIKDYRWTSGMYDSASDTLSQRKLDEFPVLTVFEYHPYAFSNYIGLLYNTIRWGSTALNAVPGAADSYGQIVNAVKCKVFNTAVSSPSDIWATIRDEWNESSIFGPEYLQNYNRFSDIKTPEDKKRAVLGQPMVELSSVVAKEKICEYHLPWFTREETLAVDIDSQLGSYTTLEDFAGERGLLKAMAGKVDSFIKAANDFLPTSLPPMFDWRFDYAQAQKPSVKNRFVLYNATWNDLVKNFKFLVTLSSGPFWLQVDDVRYSQNLYRVKVPGRFDLECCTMGIKISYRGATRILGQGNDDRKRSFRDLYLTAGVRPKDETAGLFRDFEKNMLDFFVPDMYVVDVQFSSLLPQNFNTFINMLGVEAEKRWSPVEPFKPIIGYETIKRGV